MSAKLHSGWICDVQFLSSAGPGAAAGGGSTLLLSASNDAIVALWDVSKAAGGKPLKLLESREVHQGSGGPRQCVLRQRVPIIATPGIIAVYLMGTYSMALLPHVMPQVASFPCMPWGPPF